MVDIGKEMVSKLVADYLETLGMVLFRVLIAILATIIPKVLRFEVQFILCVLLVTYVLTVPFFKQALYPCWSCCSQSFYHHILSQTSPRSGS
jgi:hypothetical protein